MTSTRCIMHTPPKYSTIRVTNTKDDRETVKKRLQTFVSKDGYTGKVVWHDVLDDVLVVQGQGPNVVNPVPVEVYVDRKCGAAVFRGAHVHAVGVLATSTPTCEAGQSASLWIDLNGKCLRGSNKPLTGRKLFLGNGIMKIDRKDAFAVPQKLLRGCEGFGLTEPIWNHPNLPNVLEGVGVAQNVPSILVGHVLDPRLGDRILDMCSAPGGKALHIAGKLNGTGALICLDQSLNRIEKLKETATALGLMDAGNVVCLPWDCTKNMVLGEDCCSTARDVPPFAPESFDKILLDTPCSGRGQRPIFLQTTSEAQIQSYPIQQRRLLQVAYSLLRPGGTLVYSTCTLLAEENECTVLNFLASHPRMKLVPQVPYISATHSQFDMPENERELLQKFDPSTFCLRHKGACFSTCDYDIQSSVPCDFQLGCDLDTIGFFIAKFEKS